MDGRGTRLAGLGRFRLRGEAARLAASADAARALLDRIEASKAPNGEPESVLTLASSTLFASAGGEPHPEGHSVLRPGLPGFRLTHPTLGEALLVVTGWHHADLTESEVGDVLRKAAEGFEDLGFEPEPEPGPDFDFDFEPEPAHRTGQHVANPPEASSE